MATTIWFGVMAHREGGGRGDRFWRRERFGVMVIDFGEERGLGFWRSISKGFDNLFRISGEGFGRAE